MKKFFGDEKVKQLNEPLMQPEKKVAKSEINYKKSQKIQINDDLQTPLLLNKSYEFSESQIPEVKSLNSKKKFKPSDCNNSKNIETKKLNKNP